MIKAGPVEDRSCRDSLCLIVFFVFLGSFIGLTGYFVSEGSKNFDELTIPDSIKNNEDSIGAIFVQIIPQVIVMIFVSIFLSILFVILTVLYPKCVVYTGIIVTFLTYIALIVLGIVT